MSHLRTQVVARCSPLRSSEEDADLEDPPSMEDADAPGTPEGGRDEAGLEDRRPGSEHDPDALARRIPNLGHALLFVSFTALMLVVLQAILFALGRSPLAEHGGAVTIHHPRLQLATMATTYLTTLLAAWFYYPMVWRRTFLVGLRWHWTTARSQAAKLVALGFLLGVMMQIFTSFVTPPKTLPIDEFFLTAADAWLITVFGTMVAPVFEEICFRGFLVPAIAIAYDWLSLPRTPVARMRWQTTATLSPAAMIFSAVLSSIFFALLHAQQVAGLWAALLGLFSVSLVLTLVRVKTGSVAASAVVHGAYNFFVFLTVMMATGGYRHLDRMTR